MPKRLPSVVFSLYKTILRTFFEAEAETRIPPLVFASVMMLKPAFHRWRFKIVRTVDKSRQVKIHISIDATRYFDL